MQTILILMRLINIEILPCTLRMHNKWEGDHISMCTIRFSAYLSGCYSVSSDARHWNTIYIIVKNNRMCMCVCVIERMSEGDKQREKENATKWEQSTK